MNREFDENYKWIEEIKQRLHQLETIFDEAHPGLYSWNIAVYSLLDQIKDIMCKHSSVKLN